MALLGGFFARLSSVFLLFSTAGGSCAGPRTQTALLANLTADYDSRERPQPDGPPVDVEVQIFLSSLTEMNQKEQQIGVAGYFRVWWTDPRLAFASKAEGGCVDSIRVTQAERENLWQPDLYFDNSLKEAHGADLFIIYPSGLVWKSDRIIHTFECKMDFKHLPYDAQICKLVVGSYSEDATEVRIHPRGGDGGLDVGESGSIDTSVWSVDEAASYAAVEEHNSIQYTYVQAELTLKRRPDYYVRGIVMKAVLFVLVSWCSFFVNRTVAPARVAISVIPVLIMMNLMNSVDNVLPPISYTTFLTAFLMTCLFFASLSVFEYAVVAYLLQIEVWYAEKCAVLMTLSSTALKKPKEAPADETIKVHHPAANANGVHENTAHHFQDHPVVTDIFAEFDQRHKGCFSAQEMRKTLRRYGQYRSANEVREIFERIGVVEGEDMNLEQFERFLKDPKTYMPVAATKRSFWDLPHSLQLDIVMRFSYLVAFVLVTFIQAMILLF